MSDQHIDEGTLRAFSDGRLSEDEDQAVFDHILFCDGRCLAYLDSLSDAQAAVFRAIQRRHRPGRRW